jgi:hypothetical protein
MMDAHTGSCERCAHAFRFELVHCGFNDTSYAYCDDCGCVALIEPTAEKTPGIPRHRSIEPDGEALLADCPCGGRFRSGATPRCPACRASLDALRAARYIECAVQPVAAGWKWQGDWRGLYCMIVERRFVRNPRAARHPPDRNQ